MAKKGPKQDADVQRSVLLRGKRSTSTMAHELLSDVFYKLSPKMKERYLDKIALIKNDDPCIYAGKG